MAAFGTVVGQVHALARAQAHPGDFEEAPLAKLADQCIYVATGSASYVDSPTVVASVLHVLATVTTASAKGARRRLVERDRLNTELGLYVN